MKLAKILSALLCFAMLFSLVSCSMLDLTDLKDLINKNENTNSSSVNNGENWKEELEKEENKKEETEDKGDDIVFGSVEYYIQEIGKAMATARVKVTTQETRDMNGQTINLTTVFYYDDSDWEQESTYGIKIMCVDDTIYYSSSYQGIKNKLPNATEKGFEAAQSVGVNDSNGGINAYAEKSVIENGDGTITIRLEGASDSFKELMGANTPDEQVQEITFDENYHIISDIIHQVTGSTSVDSTATYSYDDARDVTAPEDADEYKEVSSLDELYY